MRQYEIITQNNFFLPFFPVFDMKNFMILMKNIFLTITVFLWALVLQAKVYDFTYNNKIDLLINSRDAADLKIELIKNAHHHIHIMTYYLDSTPLPSNIINELKNAHERGVEVRLLSTFVPVMTKDFFRKTNKALRINDGGAVFSYQLLHPIHNLKILNNLHEKIFIIDGEKAIIGGRNLSDNSYRTKDMEALVEGDLVLQLQDHFRETLNFVIDINKVAYCKFKFQKVACLDSFEKQKFSPDDQKFFPVQKTLGNIKARLLSHDSVIEQVKHNYTFEERKSMPDDIINAVIASSFQTMRAYNYFILPTKAYQDFLFKNVDGKHQINIITNSLDSAAAISDKGYIYSLPILQDYVKHGINLYQWQGVDDEEYLHEKVIIFDDDHVFLGSHNFGLGSTTVSNEISVEFFSKEIATTLVNIFDSEINSSKVTMKATLNSLDLESSDNSGTVSILRDTFLGKLLEETY